MGAKELEQTKKKITELEALHAKAKKEAAEAAAKAKAAETQAQAKSTGNGGKQELKSYSLAKEQSFGFFDDVDDENWQNMQKIAAEMVDHNNMRNPLKYLPPPGGS